MPAARRGTSRWCALVAACRGARVQLHNLGSTHRAIRKAQKNLYSVIDVPGGLGRTRLDLATNGGSTYANTINNLGVIGGVIENRTDSAFLATVTSVSAVPEPSSWAMFAVGMAVVGSAASKRKQTQTNNAA
jgi:hypothetical protein